MCSLSAVHSYDLYHIHITSFSSYNRYKLKLHLTCFQQGFISSIGRASHWYCGGHGFKSVGASEFFLGFICNCLSYFIPARITFPHSLYLKCTHDLYHIHIVTPHSHSMSAYIQFFCLLLAVSSFQEGGGGGGV